MKYYFSVTSVKTGKKLEPDGWGDEWVTESETPADDDDVTAALRERAAIYHETPADEISAYIYHKKE